MSKIAFIYPGQGAQKCGMGADFYENSASVRKLFDEAGEQLGLDMKALCFEENDLLDQTEYTQAAMVTTCLAMTEVLMERGVKPDITAGLSLGEYAAISVAGPISINVSTPSAIIFSMLCCQRTDDVSCVTSNPGLLRTSVTASAVTFVI